MQNDLQDKQAESSSTRPINRPTHSPWSSSRPIVVFVGGEEGQSNCGEAEERDGELRPRIASSSSDPIMVFGTFFSFSLLLFFFSCFWWVFDCKNCIFWWFCTWNMTQAGMLVGFFFYLAIAGSLLPGKVVPGAVLSDGTRLYYRCNGMWLVLFIFSVDFFLM